MGAFGYYLIIINVIGFILFAVNTWLYSNTAEGQIYLGIINCVTFAAFAVDKMAAIEKRSRIRIDTLLGLCFIGGSLGGLGAMYLFHHKTKKDYFTVGVPLIIVMQVVVIFLLNEPINKRNASLPVIKTSCEVSLCMR